MHLPAANVSRSLRDVRGLGQPMRVLSRGSRIECGSRWAFRYRARRCCMMAQMKCRLAARVAGALSRAYAYLSCCVVLLTSRVSLSPYASSHPVSSVSLTLRPVFFVSPCLLRLAAGFLPTFILQAQRVCGEPMCRQQVGRCTVGLQVGLATRELRVSSADEWAGGFRSRG
jgi:hypothetical protein